MYARCKIPSRVVANNYDLYWSQLEDCANQIVKAAMTRNRFRTIKKCFHFESTEDREGEIPDRYKKVRMLVNTSCLS
jgi:hypothetical protein